MASVGALFLWADNPGRMVGLSDQLPPIFLGGQPTTHHRWLFLGDRNGHPLLARDLNEAWLGAGSYRPGKSNAVTHHFGPTVALFRRQTPIR